MKINVKSVQQLIKERFKGNISQFAKAIGIERSHASKVLSRDGKGGGRAFIGGMIGYCEREGLNYKDYIFFEAKCEKN